jgi:ribosome-binding protein aMBF1 (putative translation factor)
MKREPKTTMTITRNDIPQVLREARARLRLTQLDLSRRVGCSESQISKIETGRATPEGWLREAIARELGVRSWEVCS